VQADLFASVLARVMAIVVAPCQWVQELVWLAAVDVSMFLAVVV
jgi:hypothetical protein